MSKNIMIHTDIENAENHGFKKVAKKAGLAVRAPLQERPVFGAVNIPRVQPARAVKTQGVVHEKAFQKLATARQDKQKLLAPLQLPTFSIYEDVPAVDSRSDQVINIEKENCKTVGVPEKARACTEINKEVLTTYSDSPMVLDSSFEEEMSEEKRLLIDERQDLIVCIPEYRKEIYSYLREAEIKFRPKADYMRKQMDITHTMRSILIDWLVEVAEEYKLSRETLCLTVSCIDRFLSVMSVVRSKLQLVGAAAMFIASKYEEVYPPEVQEFVYITDDTYTMKQVLQMEQLILKVLSFSITVPTINGFCTELIKEMALSEDVTALTMYLAELTLLDGEPFLKYLPSVTATSCFCYASFLVGERCFMPRVTEMTGYHFEDLRECVADVLKALHRAPIHPQQAIYTKYSQAKLSYAAKVKLPDTVPLEFP